MSEGTMNTDLHVYAGDVLVGTIAKDEYDAILGNLNRDRMLRFEQITHYASHSVGYLIGLFSRAIVSIALGPLALVILLAFTSPDSLTFDVSELQGHTAPLLRFFFTTCLVLNFTCDLMFGRLDRLFLATPRERMRLNVIRSRFNVPDANQIHVRMV